jgi:alpha-tubulin suppressor-like RCC1 family protein
VGGAVWCWGLNATGQLGNATFINSNVPVAVSGLDGVDNVATQVSAGAGHTCAVLSTGAINCWGSNETAQLGDNSTTNSNVPIATSTIDGVTLRATQVSAGYLHTCAVLQSSAVMCWGRNTSGQLGINAATAQVNTPASVVTTAMSTAVASVSAGYLHTCAVLVSGAVWCWGDNSSGQLGINSSVTKK